MSDRVLPGRELVVVIREPWHDELADSTQCQFLLWRLKNRHCNESYVRIRWLDQRWGHLVVAIRRCLAGRVVLLLTVGRHHRVVLLAATSTTVSGGRGGRRDWRTRDDWAGRWLGRWQVVFVQTHRVHDHAAAVRIAVAVRAAVARQVRHHHPTRFHRDRFMGTFKPIFFSLLFGNFSFSGSLKIGKDRCCSCSWCSCLMFDEGSLSWIFIRANVYFLRFLEIFFRSFFLNFLTRYKCRLSVDVQKHWTKSREHFSFDMFSRGNCHTHELRTNCYLTLIVCFHNDNEHFSFYSSSPCHPLTLSQGWRLPVTHSTLSLTILRYSLTITIAPHAPSSSTLRLSLKYYDLPNLSVSNNKSLLPCSM